ncbi:SURF1 family protein [Methylobacterium sp. CM6244]
MSTEVRPGALRSLLAPGIVSLICLAILLSLGIWQLQRKGEKEALIGRIVARSRVEPPAPLPARGDWDVARDEFKRVRVTGTLLNDQETLVHGLAAGAVPGNALQGFYVLTPLKRDDDGSLVIINRGFVPTELKSPSRRPSGQIAGSTTITGMLRGPETRTMFVPPPEPAKGEWFHRDIDGIAAARGLTVMPYLIEADATPNPGGWPKGGQLRVDLPNNHMQYAFTWFGIAACLVGVFGVFAWKRLSDVGDDTAANPAR